MKFQVKTLKECLSSSTSSCARLGLIKFKNSLESETPSCMLYTTSGK